ncbi:prephenate dehydratase domain-containing protein [Buchnera aphidicola (Astegopteryx bambusae)]|uniref:prephenate dehydratase domain-containing protein n=1 Tax=Buchnera aphidicola TaxID=9 RepID=UPI0031B880BE
MNLEINFLNFRNKIDKLDNKIIKLLFKRNYISKEIAKTKIILKKDIKDKNREKEILLNIYKKSKKYNISKKYIKKIFKIIINHSIKMQKKIFNKKNIQKISFLGPEGSYSYYATKKYCKKKILYKKLPYKNFNEVISALEKNIVNFSILPLENSNTGKIDETYKILEKKKLFIIKTLNIKINHCLLSKQIIKTKNIQIIYTHLQPFLQCKKFIKNFCKLSKIKFVESTSSAIKNILIKNKNNIAAIGHKKNKNFFNLKILKKNINNDKNNFTKFIVLKRNKKKIDYKKNIILIKFLYNIKKFPNNILLILYENNIKIKSLIYHKSNVEDNKNIYFVEIKNNKILTKNIKNILKKTLKITNSIKIIGNYKK